MQYAFLWPDSPKLCHAIRISAHSHPSNPIKCWKNYPRIKIPALEIPTGRQSPCATTNPPLSTDSGGSTDWCYVEVKWTTLTLSTHNCVDLCKHLRISQVCMPYPYCIDSYTFSCAPMYMHVADSAKETTQVTSCCVAVMIWLYFALSSGWRLINMKFFNEISNFYFLDPHHTLLFSLMLKFLKS